jgi:hypothetical protein
MTAENKNNYYVKKKNILMRTFNAALLISKQILIDNFGEEKFNEISATTRNEFEALLPQIPYVGGDSLRFLRKKDLNIERLVESSTNYSKLSINLFYKQMTFSQKNI